MFRSLVDSTLARAAARLRSVPSQCVVCAAWPARIFCDDCVQRFAQPVARCATCALAVVPGTERCGACRVAAPPLDRCLAAVTYGYPWADCITDLKFHGRTGLARALALLLRSTPWVEPALDAARWVLPMPLSRERLHERGFNQAALLARHLAGAAKVDTGLLLRTRHTPAQSGLDRAARLAGVRGAFAVDPLLRHRLAGHAVVLVDDVMTSGASLFAAAEALRRAGAAHVTAVVVARTEFGD
ncbi:MAG: phosphoribosyltransferase family protein [Pseudomonadota bacterium]